MKLSELGSAVESLPGVGPATAKQFARMNIFTAAALLSTYPRSYDDRSRRVPLKDFQTAQKVHTVCKVTAHTWFGYGRMKTLKIAVSDGTANAWLVAFNRPFLEKSLPEGSIIAVTGRFEQRYGELQSSAFEAVRLAYDGELSAWQDAPVPGSGVIPVYPLTEGLSQKNFHKTVAAALRLYAKGIDDELPQDVIASRKLLHKAQAITQVHAPADIAQAQEARRTLIYEELYHFEYKMAERALAHRGSLPSLEETAVFEGTARSRADDAAAGSAPPSAAPFFSTPDSSREAFEKQLSPLQKQLLQRLPFELTAGQAAAITDMNRDIDKSSSDLNTLRNAPQTLTRQPFSMQRLLQGDVGSGKTLTAFFACLRVIDYGGQCAFLAPTELLARQHAENAAAQLEPLGVRIAFLTGNVKASGRNALLKALREGSIDIVLGTHALFSSSVQYKNLQLAVIDEQHRFGVAQRESIVAKGRTGSGGFFHTPDVLMMSATPIPQTLALSVFGDLDVSTIRTMPQGRRAIKTYLSVMGHERNAYEAVRKELEAGHQAYFVYPRISEFAGTAAESAEESSSAGDGAAAQDSQGSSGLKSAEEMHAYLSGQIYPGYSCALIHSKIEEEEQHRILDDFRAGKIQVLVATTVVEVGVDVPNATCIVIEHADRFGLAELHQLRGRVGRGSLQSYCFLIYGKDITETGIARMKALHESTDGFVIAEEDLKLRGPGEVSGTAQSGYLSLGIADLSRDKDLLSLARYDAFTHIRKVQAT
jgi:ATP-dependent DNA helicase RecG